MQTCRPLSLWHLTVGGVSAQTARMHAHPCPAVISVQAPGRVVVWGTCEWFAGEAGDGVPKLPLADMADTHQPLFSLSLSLALLCSCVMCVGSTAGNVMGRVAAAGATLPSTNGAAPEVGK